MELKIGIPQEGFSWIAGVGKYPVYPHRAPAQTQKTQCLRIYVSKVQGLSEEGGISEKDEEVSEDEELMLPSQ